MTSRKGTKSANEARTPEQSSPSPLRGLSDPYGGSPDLPDGSPDDQEQPLRPFYVVPKDGAPYVDWVDDETPVSKVGKPGDQVHKVLRFVPYVERSQAFLYVIERLGMNKYEQPFMHAVSCAGPGRAEVELNTHGDPVIYVLHAITIKNREDGSERTKIEMLKQGRVTVASSELNMHITEDRTLEPAPETLRYSVVNHTFEGPLAPVKVRSADLLKARTQSQWPDLTLIAQSVPARYIGKLSEYVRALGSPERCTVRRTVVDGLGPVILNDGNRTRVFAGTTGSIEFGTGRFRDDVLTEGVDNGSGGLAQLGISRVPEDTDLKAAYRELGRLLDCAPNARAVCAVLVGAMMLAPLSTIDRQYRVCVFLHGKKGTGKTSYVKLLLSTQSPSARGFEHTKVSVQARPGRGGTTANGYLMILQRAGGFFALLDDYTVAGMPETLRAQRDEGLSIAVGAMIEGAAVKQTWTKLGPEFANTNSPQASYVVNGELPATNTASTLNRIVEIEFPPYLYGEKGGLSDKLMRELHSVESGDLRHLAWSDSTIRLLKDPDIGLWALDQAAKFTDQWTDLDHRTRDMWSRAIAGLFVFERRAKELRLGPKYQNLAAKFAEDLYREAKKQSSRLEVATEPLISRVRRLWKELLQDKEVSIAGPPSFDAVGNVVKAWTEPFRKDTADDKEQSPYIELPSWLGNDRGKLGFRQDGAGAWLPNERRIVGFFHAPPKTGRKPVYPYRIECNSDQLSVLARELTKRSRRYDGPDIDVRDLKRELVDQKRAIVVKKTGRIYVIDAQWLLSDDPEDKE